MGVRNENSTDYVHNDEPNILNLHKAMDYNPAGQPIIRTTGDQISWGIQVSDGSMPGVAYIEKFGMNVDVDSNKETIWDGGGIYTYQTTAHPVSVTSDAPTFDLPGGTGARTVEVQGLDGDYNLVTEVIDVGSAGTQPFLRIFRVKLVSSGSEGINHGNIFITCTVTSLVLAQIGLDGSGSNAAGRGQTFMALYTIPAGKTGYLTQWTVGAGKANTDAIATFMVRNTTLAGDGAWNARDIITVSATTYSKDYKIPMQIPEKHDIEVRAYSSVNNSLVSSTFNLIMVDNT